MVKPFPDEFPEGFTNIWYRVLKRITQFECSDENPDAVMLEWEDYFMSELGIECPLY